MDELKTHECWVYDYGCRADMVSKTDVDAAIAEKDAEIRRLERALYKACANWACAKMEYEQFDSNVFMFGVTTTDKEVSWESMMKKCQAKAEEYK